MAPLNAQKTALSGIHQERVVYRDNPEITDPVWVRLRQDVFEAAKSEPMLAGYLSLSNSFITIIPDTERHRRISVHSQVV